MDLELVDVRKPARHLEPDCVAETHISRVFCQGNRVYKVKKAVKTDFLDLRDRDQRYRMCWREVALNSRMAPDVYLGVIDYKGEPAVLMRRMPEGCRLSTLVTLGMDVRRDLRAVARVIAAFHSRADRGDVIDHAATARAVQYLWTENLTELARFPEVADPSVVRRLLRLSQRYIAGRGKLFDARIAAGKVCDGHGDLLADDIFCLDDGPRILDCVEFNDTFRFADVLADVAFLAMDLERLGHPDLGGFFLDAYREFSGDNPPQSLAHLYIAYRALVRAKVACLRHQQGDHSAGGQVRALLDLCLRHLQQTRCVLTLIGGPPGSGKTTLANALGEAVGWAVIRTDEVRHDIAGIGRDEPAPAPYGMGIFDAATTAATYAEAIRRAEAMLALGESVIIDATWSTDGWRTAATAAALATHSDVAMLRCDAPEATRLHRVGGRPLDAPSLNIPAIARQIGRSFDEWPESAGINTNRSLVASLSEATAAIARAAPASVEAGSSPLLRP